MQNVPLQPIILTSNSFKMASDIDFSTRSKKFLNWFKSQPGTYFHHDLKIVDLRSQNAGRGIIATKRIEPDTNLFIIPRSLVITKENSTLYTKDPNIFERLDEIPDLDEENAEWLKLVVTLIYEDFCGEGSPWKPYIDVLPEIFDTLMFWTDEQVKELQASAVVDKIGKSEADELFRTKLLPFFLNHQYIFSRCGRISQGEEKTLVHAHQMSSTIMAYAFDLEREEDEDEADDGWVEDRTDKTLGMVPMADMLNADAEFNAHLSHGEENLTMTSLRPIEAGEEVLNYYGPLPNSDLLRRYGYTSTKNRAHDIVELRWRNITEAVKAHVAVTDDEIRSALASFGEDDLEDSFVLEAEPVEPSSEGLLPRKLTAVKTIPEDLAAQTTALLDELKQIKPSLKQESSVTLWDVFRTAMVSRLAEYSTTATEDEKLLRDATGRKRMAIEVRLGEKRILQAALELVDQELKDNNHLEGERQTKRQRLEH